MITAEFVGEGSSCLRRVAIDPDAATVTFDNCHFSRRFLAWGTDPHYTCRLSELRGACWNVGGCDIKWRRVPVLEVVTPAGRAIVPEAAAGFEAVHAAIVAGIPDGVRLRWYDYPAGQSLVAVLVVFPVGIAVTLLCAVILERRLISAKVLAGLFAALVPLVFLRHLSMSLGRPTLR